MSVIAEYIWIDNDYELRSKARTVTPANRLTPGRWNFDGSSTGQAVGHDSEVILVPCAIFDDPFRGGLNVLVLCECYDKTGKNVYTNSRHNAKKIFDQIVDKQPWFGLEQEYVLYSRETKRPLGWGTSDDGDPEPQGRYYCGVGAGRVFGRDIVDEHYKMCLQAGINISGVNAEVMPGQWEYQVGPCTGIDSGDQLWIARYILIRLCEKYDVYVSLEPKPVEGDWNGSGCHMNYSDVDMRSKEDGITHILACMPKLEAKHAEHIEVYGTNSVRLSGAHETSSINRFSFGVADRGASVRIGSDVHAQGFGYFEDRRPASDCDPYAITAKLCETIYEL